MKIGQRANPIAADSTLVALSKPPSSPTPKVRATTTRLPHSGLAPRWLWRLRRRTRSSPATQIAIRPTKTTLAPESA
jgi:hypothetical protein